jgi:ADP-heptose:LPS heptosyltransferase
VLVLRQLGLGDLLAGVPALRGLRSVLPDHELVLAAPAPLGPLVDLVDAVHRLLPSGELEPVPWTGPPPEVAVDLHGNGPASHVLLEVLAPGRLVAFDVPGGPVWDHDEHERPRWCRLVGGGDPDDVLLPAPSREPAVTGAVVVHPGAASESRRWPAGRFAEVARWVAGTGRRVVVTGSVAERGLAAEVADSAGLPREAVLAGRTDLADLAALVAAADLVVAGDTGVAHLASAYAVPSVLLFGPTPPSRWGPPAGGPHTVLWHGTGLGDPHADTIDPVVAAIEVAEVVEAARLRLAHPPARKGSLADPRSTAASG